MVEVYSLKDLPTPIDGVINLEAGFSYVIIGRVDLSGHRFHCLGDVCIRGISSETSFLTSTGLTAGVPLITTAFSLPMQDLTIHDVDTGMYIGDTANIALDWSNFNLLNIPNIGTIGTASNLVCSFLAFFDCANWIFTGTVGTVSFINSLFTNFRNAPIFDLTATANITRRLRFRDCSFTVTGTGSAIKKNALASLPVDQFILRDNNFAGGASPYIVGALATDNISDWSLNKGISNSQNYAALFADNNVTVTNTGLPNTFTKILGATTILQAQRFTHSNNRLTYTGAILRTFALDAIVSLSGGNNIDFSIQIRVYNSSNVLVHNSVGFRETTNGGGRANNIAAKTFYALNTNDYVEIWIASASNNQNVTVVDLFLSASTIT